MIMQAIFYRYMNMLLNVLTTVSIVGANVIILAFTSIIAKVIIDELKK